MSYCFWINILNTPEQATMKSIIAAVGNNANPEILACPFNLTKARNAIIVAIKTFTDAAT